MDLNNSLKKIKDTVYILSSKDVEVMVKFSGYSGGATKPYAISIDSFQTNGATIEEAMTLMFHLLKDALEQKVSFAQSQVDKYNSTLKEFSSN